MAQITTNAIVLRAADYKEYDRMVTLFSPERGRIEALCRGCRKQKSPLLAASEPFASGEYVLWQGGERAVVSSCQVSDAFFPLREDFERLSHGMYLLELCLAAVQPEQENARLFMLLLRCLAYLAYGDTAPRRVTAVFLMGILSLMGFRPTVGRCARCGRTLSAETDSKETAAVFSQEAGGLLCASCGMGVQPKLSGGELLFLQHIMRKGVQSLEEPDECTDAVFGALRTLTENRLDVQTRSGKLL